MREISYKYMLQTSIMILIEGYQSPEITKKLKTNAKPKGNGNQALKPLSIVVEHTQDSMSVLDPPPHSIHNSSLT